MGLKRIVVDCLSQEAKQKEKEGPPLVAGDGPSGYTPHR